MQHGSEDRRARWASLGHVGLDAKEALAFFKHQDLACSCLALFLSLSSLGFFFFLKVADMKWFYSTRLETRTKECNKHASRRVEKTNLKAQ
jgi:hypothetical protein